MQKTLFEQPLSRNVDSVTSFEAAGGLHDSGRWRKQIWKVFFALRKQQGCTYRELNEGLHFEDRNVTVRRLGDLRRMGLVCNGAKRRCRVSGKRCLTWWVATNWAQRIGAGQPGPERPVKAPSGPIELPAGKDRPKDATDRAETREPGLPAVPATSDGPLSVAARQQMRRELLAKGDARTRKFLEALPEGC